MRAISTVDRGNEIGECSWEWQMGKFGKLSTAASCQQGHTPDHSPCIEDIVLLRPSARTLRAVRLVAGVESFAKRFRMRIGRALVIHQRLQFKRML